MAMDRVDSVPNEPFRGRIPQRVGRVASIAFTVISLVLFLLVWRANFQRPDVSSLLLAALVLGICLVILFVADLSLHLRRGHRETAKVLETREREFKQMADNIEEIFWTIDAESKKALYVNQAYETITGRSCRSLMGNPYSYEDLIHPDDRVPVLAKLGEATQTGQFHERFRIVLPGGELRWVSVHGFPVRDAEGRIWRLVGTAQDVTAQKQAEKQVASHLALAESAWAESEALRKATLALTQDLRMDFVLDALLQSLTELISCECARIWLLEGDTRLFVAREKLRHESPKKSPNYPLTLDAAGIPFLQRILGSQKSILLADTKHEADWQTFKGHTHLRSWLCVPLVASQRTLGLLSVGHAEPDSFTREDLRRAQLLAIPAAAAIQNSRLYECASIYGSELEKRINDLHEAQHALEQSEESRKISEDKFQKVFRSSPVAFSITTVNEGRFLDVNTAFECRYGYSRTELIGHTVYELRMWEDPADRSLMLAQLQKSGPVRNVITRLRTRSGDIKVTAYSADQIELGGHPCILAVSEDVPSRLSN
jgi:PAS domain S-box-containing protein